jgi:hypothetical protein
MLSIPSRAARASNSLAAAIASFGTSSYDVWRNWQRCREDEEQVLTSTFSKSREKRQVQKLKGEAQVAKSFDTRLISFVPYDEALYMSAACRTNDICERWRMCLSHQRTNSPAACHGRTTFCRRELEFTPRTSLFHSVALLRTRQQSSGGAASYERGEQDPQSEHTLRAKRAGGGVSKWE